MAAAILSQDIVAICLLCIDGNIDLSLTEVIRRVEAYQEAQDRHFGISRYDFRGLFRTLVCRELGIKSFADEIDDIKLSDIIIDILEYHDAYFNDEGEYWFKGDETYSEGIASWFDYTEKEYEYRMKVKQQMKRFLRRQEITTLDPKLVKNFMEEKNITDAILYHCSRPGESS